MADPVIEELERIVGPDRVLSAPEDLMTYEIDGYTMVRGRPRAVVFPSGRDELVAVIRCLAAAGVPFIPRGAGTGLSGGTVAREGEVLVSLVRMNRIADVDRDARIATVEPGVVNLQLTRAVSGRGLYYAPDPSSQQTCTIGGNVAENSGGPHCLKYGVTTNHVLGLDWIMPDGEVVQTGSGAPDPPGYDLTGILVGSEGTLGVAAEVRVRLLRRPEAVRTVLALFDSVEQASQAVSDIIAAGVIPAALEMMDALAIRAVEMGAFPVGYPPDVQAVLLVEVDGVGLGPEEEAAAIVGVCQARGVREVRVAAGEAERAHWWANRKTAFGAMGKLAPDYYVQDGVIPRSRLPEVLARLEALSREHGFPIANVFHAGDGNVHPLIPFDRRVPGASERVVQLGTAILAVCAEVGGSITGEHGVGIEKQNDMALIFTPEDIAHQQRLRQVFDPHNLCNPGKLFPEPGRCAAENWSPTT